MSAVIAGIDPGVTGALALPTHQGALLDRQDMPSLADRKKGRSTGNEPLLAERLAKWHAFEVFCEFVSARLTDGSVQAFGFGTTFVCGALSPPISLIAPQARKRFQPIPAVDQKGLARSKPIARWPAMAGRVARKLDHNRAESALIGLAELRQGGAK
jgi:hypothetical protein